MEARPGLQPGWCLLQQRANGTQPVGQRQNLSDGEVSEAIINISCSSFLLGRKSKGSLDQSQTRLVSLSPLLLPYFCRCENIRCYFRCMFGGCYSAQIFPSLHFQFSVGAEFDTKSLEPKTQVMEQSC